MSNTRCAHVVVLVGNHTNYPVVAIFSIQGSGQYHTDMVSVSDSHDRDLSTRCPMGVPPIASLGNRPLRGAPQLQHGFFRQGAVESHPAGISDIPEVHCPQNFGAFPVQESSFLV